MLNIVLLLSVILTGYIGGKLGAWFLVQTSRRSALLFPVLLLGPIISFGYDGSQCLALVFLICFVAGLIREGRENLKRQAWRDVTQLLRRAISLKS